MAARQTPATRLLEEAGVRFALHEYAHDPGQKSFGLEAATALALDPGRVFKTLVVEVGDAFRVCMVPVWATLDLGTLGKHAALAPVERAERITGYVAGGIAPLGQRRKLPTLIDDSVLEFDTVFVSAGRRGLELELSPRDLIIVTGAEVRKLRRRDP
jgi:Cys-tRNA(Pro)/Cys-tRNA(Cys) deacylase